MSEITVRPYQPGDLAACRALWVELTQAHRDLYGDPVIGGADPGRFFDRHLELVDPQRLWVAVGADQVVGLVGLIVSSRTTEGREAEVEPVVVATAYRGWGVGQALLARVVAEAQALGVRYLSVKPVARNREAIRFYYDAGFCLLGEIEMFMDLQPPATETWRSGLELFGCKMRY
jgi:GNAT superfamily N-acetyltransferase